MSVYINEYPGEHFEGSYGRLKPHAELLVCGTAYVGSLPCLSHTILYSTKTQLLLLILFLFLYALHYKTYNLFLLFLNISIAG